MRACVCRLNVHTSRDKVSSPICGISSAVASTDRPFVRPSVRPSFLPSIPYVRPSVPFVSSVRSSGFLALDALVRFSIVRFYGGYWLRATNGYAYRLGRISLP